MLRTVSVAYPMKPLRLPWLTLGAETVSQCSYTHMPFGTLELRQLIYQWSRPIVLQQLSGLHTSLIHFYPHEM